MGDLRIATYFGTKSMKGLNARTLEKKVKSYYENEMHFTVDHSRTNKKGQESKSKDMIFLG